MIYRLAATLFVLLTAGLVSASDPLYRKVAYTETEYRWYCGRYYPYEVTKYRYEAYTPPEPVKAIPYGPGWKEAVVKARAEQIDYENYETALRLLGLTAPGRAGYAANGYGLTGDTRYGYTLSQVTDIYNRDEVGQHVQSAALLLQGMQAGQDKAFDRLMAVIEKEGGNKQRFLEMLIQGVNIERAFLASRAAPQTTTTTTAKVEGATPTPVKAKAPAAFAKCVGCHTGEKAKAGLDFANWSAFTPDQKRRTYNAVLTPDEDRRMPRAEGGGPGEPLTVEEVRAIVTQP